MEVMNAFRGLNLVLVIALVTIQTCSSFLTNNIHQPISVDRQLSMRCSVQEDELFVDRRSIVKICGGLLLGTSVRPGPASAKSDCMSDCLKNCKLIAPKDSAYCLENCKSYCEQDDRTDGLSGSVSSQGGEMGILGTGTVVKGEDKPPSLSLPGLDFTSDKGKKLIGY